MYEEFAAEIRSYLSGDRAERAQRDLAAYYDPVSPFTGSQFELIADRSSPNEITARDLIAVSMLDVTVPAAVAVWLLSDVGRAEVSELLEQVPPDATIREGDAHLAEGGALWQLWDLVGRACWPTPRDGNGMGPTIKSKLLAAKRPALVPVLDSVVRAALPPVDDYWAAFAATFDNETTLLASIALMPRPEHVPILRALDVVIWQAHRRRVPAPE